MPAACFQLLLLLLTCDAVRADTVVIGGTDVNYHAPAGYAPAEGGKYAYALSLMRQMMGDMQLHAVYVPKKDKGQVTEPDVAVLEKYLVVTYSRRLQDSAMGLQDFRELKDYLTENQGQLTGSDMQEKVNRSLTDLGAGDLQIGSVKPLGIFGVTDTSISYMAMITQVVQEGGKQVPVEQVLVSTLILAEGKVVVINQYDLVNSPADVASFREESVKTIKSMDFREGAATQTAPQEMESRHSADYYAARAALTGALIAVLIGVTIINIKKKRGAE